MKKQPFDLIETCVVALVLGAAVPAGCIQVQIGPKGFPTPRRSEPASRPTTAPAADDAMPKASTFGFDAADQAAIEAAAKEF